MSENQIVEEDSTFDDPEGVVTLDEVLQYENKLMEDTAAVLGDMSDKNCSYVEVSVCTLARLVLKDYF